MFNLVTDVFHPVTFIFHSVTGTFTSVTDLFYFAYVTLLTSPFYTVTL